MAEHRNDTPRKIECELDLESSEKCEGVSSPVRQLFEIFEAKCVKNSDTKNERKSGTKNTKPVKRKVWTRLPSGLFGFRVAGRGSNGNASEPKPKQPGAPSAEARKRKITIQDGGGGDRLRPGEKESESLRLVAKRSRCDMGSD